MFDQIANLVGPGVTENEMIDEKVDRNTFNHGTPPWGVHTGNVAYVQLEIRARMQQRNRR